MYPTFKRIGLDITEKQYRNDGAMHYSTLAKYSRGGFGCLDTLFDRQESPSLTFGSCVDSIITGGMEEFNERFLVAEYPALELKYIEMVKALFDLYKDSYAHLFLIPDISIIQMSEKIGFYRNWKPETRAKVIKEKGCEYYDLLHLAENKTLIDSETYTKVQNTVMALRESEATKRYFEADNPFDDSIERLYQMKFHSEFNGVPYSCMAD